MNATIKRGPTATPDEMRSHMVSDHGVQTIKTMTGLDLRHNLVHETAALAYPHPHSHLWGYRGIVEEAGERPGDTTRRVIAIRS